MRSSPRKRVLIVNCYLDESRRTVARGGKVPQTIGPVFLAGWFAPAQWDIRLHNEHSHGPLEDEHLLGWCDLLVLTGLTIALDRMRHLTAYARSRNPHVVVVGGGHAVRAFPRYCDTFLDVACLGDVEEIRDVIADGFGPEYVNEAWEPRYDLAPWVGRVGYAESTRYCNFRCSFCTLTGEGRTYEAHPIDTFRQQIRALGRRSFVAVLDNNFYGNDRSGYEARVDVMREAWEAGQFRGWSTLVTGDFFLRDGNAERLAKAGCTAVFSGVESFDPTWTEAQNKRQNGRKSPVEVIRGSLEAGLVLTYGLILDVYTRSLDDLRREIDFVFGRDDIALPTFMCLPTPYPGTPHFYSMLDAEMLLPMTRVRDLDTTTISARTLDPLPEVAAFTRDLQRVRGHRRQLLRHSVRFSRRYWRRLGPDQMLFAVGGGLVLAAPFLLPPPRRISRLSAPRTHVSTTDPLDPVYRPAFRVDSRFEPYFRPTMLTDAEGRSAEAIAEDVDAARPPRGGDALPVLSGAAVG